MGWCMRIVSPTPLAPFQSCSAKTATQVHRPSSHWQLMRTRSGAAFLQTRIHAIDGSDYILAAINSPAATGDYSVIVPVSAAFFFLYWITNFVVPDVLANEIKKEGEKQARKERIPSEDEK